MFGVDGVLWVGVDESGGFIIQDGGILNSNGNNKVGNNNNCTGTLIIEAGGTVNANGGWMMIAGSSLVTGVVEVSGTLNTEGHLWMATGAGSTATMDIYGGGVVTVGENIGLGTVAPADATNTGGPATINVHDGGLLTLDHWHNTGSIRDGSVLNINGTGIVTVGGNRVDAVNAYAGLGKITGNGIAGNVEATYDADADTTTLALPGGLMGAWPVNITVKAGAVELSWTNLAPDNPADPVYVDVWFGTDPNKLSLLYELKVDAGEDANSVTVSAPVIGDPPTTYFWQVDSYILGPGHINDANMIEGKAWSFDVTSDLPPAVVDAGLNLITWIGKLTPINATVVDDSPPEEVTIAWSADPAEGVGFSATDVEAPNVTFAPRRTVVKEIQHNDYDAEEHINAQTPDTDNPYGTVEIRSSDLELGSEGNGGLDWQVIAVQYDTLGIPQGANILSAKITFQIDNSGEGAGRSNDFTILAEAADDAVLLNSDPNITGRARSAASVAWAPAAEPAQGSKLDTPDITALIQEVVNQAGWSEDNRLTLMIYPDVYLALPDPSTGGDTPVQEIEFEASDGDDSATLSVRYELPEGYTPASGVETYTLTLAVHDEINTTPVESTMTIDVYENPCYAAIAAGEGADYIADSNEDCIINLADLAAMIAPYWADDYALTVPVPGP